MRMIDSKMKELECSHNFSHYKSMGIFPDAQGQLTLKSLVRSSRIWNSLYMDDLVTCKYEEDLIKNEKRGNKQCLLDTPRRVTVNNKRLISKRKKSEKKYAYIQKAMALLRIQREITLITKAPSS